MDRFKNYKNSYEESIENSIAFCPANHAFFTEEKARQLLDITARLVRAPGDCSFLDVGCGVGSTDRLLTDHVASLTGVDVSEPMLEKARSTNPNVSYTLQQGPSLPFAEENFDVTFAINVMHHVPPDQWETFLREANRVTKKTGVVIVMEHNPWNPLTRLTVNRCEFDEDAVLLTRKRLSSLFQETGLRVIDRGYIHFLPWRGTILRRIEAIMKPLPLGAQHYLCGRRRS